MYFPYCSMLSCSQSHTMLQLRPGGCLVKQVSSIFMAIIFQSCSEGDQKWNTLGRLEATNLSFIHTLSHLYIQILIHTSMHFTETIALKPIVWKPLNAHALYCRIYRAVVFDDYRGTYRMFWYICECDFWEIKSGNGWRFRFCAFCE